jgi:signal peptidase I
VFGLDKDTGNLIIIISVLGILTCLCLWLLKSLNIILKNRDIKDVENYLSWIGVSLAFLILLMIFVTAGDLGILLLIGSIVSFLLMVVGLIAKNTEITKTGRGWFFPFFLIFVLRTFLFEPYQIPSGSMMPGLKVGDFILVKKFTYGIKVNRTGPPMAFGKDPELGDVVVFIPPHDHRPFVKRLIGKPGDRITYINKKIYVNGKPINQKLLSEEDNVRIYEEKLNDKTIQIQQIISRINYSEEWVVPKDMYFVVGDNRDNSNDSRYWGFVPRENFMGTADYIWMSWECWTCAPSFKRAGKIN